MKVVLFFLVCVFFSESKWNNPYEPAFLVKEGEKGKELDHSLFDKLQSPGISTLSIKDGTILTLTKFIDSNSTKIIKISKLNTLGEIIWEKRFESEKITIKQCVEIDGYSVVCVGNIKVSYQKGYMMKILPDGNIEWSKYLTDDNFGDFISVSCNTALNSGFIVLGETGYNSTRSFYFLKFTSQGDLEWIKMFDHSMSIMLTEIFQQSKNYFLFTGMISDYSFIGKLSNTGELVFLKQFQRNDPTPNIRQNIYPLKFEEKNNYFYLISAIETNIVGQESDTLTRKVIITKLNQETEIVWTKTIEQHENVNGVTYGFDAFLSNDGFVISGFTNSKNLLDSLTATLMKFNENGDHVYTKHFISKDNGDNFNLIPQISKTLEDGIIVRITTGNRDNTDTVQSFVAKFMPDGKTCEF